MNGANLPSHNTNDNIEFGIIQNNFLTEQIIGQYVEIGRSAMISGQDNLCTIKAGDRIE